MMRGSLRAHRLRAPASEGIRSVHVVSPLISAAPGVFLGGHARHPKLSPCRATNVEASASALEVLDDENRLLKQTIAEAELEAGDLIAAATAEDAAAPAAAHAYADVPTDSVSEDYWTPPQVPSSTGLVETLGALQPVPSHDGTDCFKWDKSMGGSADHFKYRWNVFKRIRQAIDDNEGGMDKFTQGYNTYGLNRGTKEGVAGIWYREWAPAAKAIALIGEFNAWAPQVGHWAVKNTFGTWELFLPDGPDGTPAIAHRTKIKCRLETPDGQWVERIPAWIKWATQEWNEIQYNGVYYAPPNKGAPGELPTPDTSYTFKYPRPAKPRSLRIYECHVGMSSREPKVNSYMEFRRDMLPKIRALGYNTIQIMAVQEHAYYGSFGYHVTNFFAASSRFGTPDELKAMIDEAHHLGMIVLMDIVHSHASKNTNDGINMFDGTDGQYFHSGDRGNHWMWDSRLFNYGAWETLRFLLSNSRWWVDEYKFDGYRFDGVTSMMYTHHGLQYEFTGNYKEYFGMETDVDAVVYMMLMNNMLKDFFPSAVTVGEDVSGMPAFARPWSEGGVGFDYRMQMAIADKWIAVLKTKTDEEWDVMDIVHCLTNRRFAEPCVGYAESHDQALVGDKTIAFWLMDAAMYDRMGVATQSPVVDRGISLHKMIRQLTMALGGESYLNFMGNEFGHPEWIDFPRDDGWDPKNRVVVKGNGGSYDKCRRRWDLLENSQLKYQFMNAFDRAMTHLDKAFGYVASPHQWISRQDNKDKLVVAERGDLVMVFNFHPTNSYTDYRIGCRDAGDYKVVLSSDESTFGGWDNVSKNKDVTFVASDVKHDGRPYSFQAYAPSRTVVVYTLDKYADKDADAVAVGVPGLAVKERGPHFQT